MLGKQSTVNCDVVNTTCLNVSRKILGKRHIGKNHIDMQSTENLKLKIIRDQ